MGGDEGEHSQGVASEAVLDKLRIARSVLQNQNASGGPARPLCKGPSMPTEHAFEIDDTKSVDENLNKFSTALTDLDNALGSVLGPRLSNMSETSTTNFGEILDALYTASASQQGPPAPSGATEAEDNQS